MSRNPSQKNNTPNQRPWSHWPRLLSTALLPLLLACSFALQAQELTLRGAISGNWYDPEQSGHGVQIEVIDESRAVVAWYVFDSEGNQVWLFGVGEIDGNTIHVTLESYAEGRFPPAFNAAMIQTEVWGDVTLTFDDCESGEMSWTPVAAGFSAGSMALARLTTIAGKKCGEAEEFETTVNFSMDAGAGTWQPVFSDFEVGALVEVEAEWSQLPAPLSHLDGWMMAGTNVSDDLALFLKTPIGGLQADTEYEVEMDVEFATNTPQDCVGIGGAPGEAVYFKVGASGTEPVAVETAGYFELNIDKGVQANGGAHAVVAGNIANSQQGCPVATQWQLKTVSTAGMNFTARTDADGRLWLFCGTDSGFEGRSQIYVTAFTARLSPAQ